MSQGGNQQNNKINSNIKKFQPAEGLSYGQLKFGYWWLNHGEQIKRFFQVVLGLIGIIFLGYGVFGFFIYIFKGINEDSYLANQIASTPIVSHEYIKSIGAQDLVLENINVISNSGGTYDFAIKARNPNEKWHVEFDYYFVAGGENLEQRHAFILPREKKYLTEFLYQSSAYPSSLELKIENLEWRRIKKRDIGDSEIEKFIQEATDIKISDLRLISGSASGLSEKKQINKAVFTAKNNTPYNYWEVDCFILLESGGRLTGINKYQIPRFLSGEERRLEIIWPGSLSGSLVVRPSVDIFNNDNYMEFDLGEGQLK